MESPNYQFLGHSGFEAAFDRASIWFCEYFSRYYVHVRVSLSAEIDPFQTLFFEAFQSLNMRMCHDVHNSIILNFRASWSFRDNSMNHPTDRTYEKTLCFDHMGCTMGHTIATTMKYPHRKKVFYVALVSFRINSDRPSLDLEIRPL